MLTQEEISRVRSHYIMEAGRASSLEELAVLRREFMKWYNEAMRSLFKPSEK